MAEQQRQRFRRGQQDMRRPHTLPRLAVRRRIPAARFNADIKAHLLYWCQQIALHIHRQRLERGDIEGVEAIKCGRTIPFVLSLSKDSLRALHFDRLSANGFFFARPNQLTQRRQKPCQCLARPRRRHKQRMAPIRRRFAHFKLMPPGLPAA